MKRGRHQSGSEGNGRKRHRGKGCTVSAEANKVSSTKILSEEGGGTSQPLSSCAICFEDTLKEKGSIVCGHSFCFTCIHTWSKTENTCPLCKKRFSSIDKVMQCAAATSSRRKQSSASSSSLKRRIPVRRRNQYTPTPPSAISASFSHGMSAIHLLVVLTEILIPRRRSFHLFGAAVSANDSDSELEWISTSNEQDFGLPQFSFGGHENLGVLMEMEMEIDSRFDHRSSLAPFLMIRNGAPLRPPAEAGTPASNPVDVEIDLTGNESDTSRSLATIRQTRIMQRRSNGSPPIRRSSADENSRHGLNSTRIPRLRPPPP